MVASKDKKKRRVAWHLATELVHAGTLRSQFGETSEAIFLNTGYVYDSAEQAEARFKGDDEGYVYSRYANPTVAMFEARMCALEGAPAARGPRDHPDRRARSQGVGGRRQTQHARLLLRDSHQPRARAGRYRRRLEDRQESRRARRGRQRLRHAAAPAADAARRRHRGLFGHQAYRRPRAQTGPRRARG